MKYHNGEPVIRELQRVSKPGRRVYSNVKELPRVYNGLGIAILSTPRGVHVGFRGARRACRRRNLVYGVLMSRIGKHPVGMPDGVKVTLQGQHLSVSGKLGELSRTLPAEVELAQENGAIAVRPRGEGKRARAMWGLSRTLVANMVNGVGQGLHAAAW